MPKKRVLSRFVLGSTPKPDESFVGYVARASERIGFSSPATLFAASGSARLTNRPKESCLMGMASLCGVETAALRATTYGPPSRGNSVYKGSALPPPLVSSGAGRRRICPECFREKIYHRSFWDLTFVSICPYHRMLLCDRCQFCGRGLGWTGSTVSRCKCRGGDFRTMTATFVPDEQVTATASVMGLLGDAQYSKEASYVKTLAPFVDLEPGEIGDFLLRMSPSVLRPQALPFTLSWLRKPQHAPHETLTAGFEMARGWPDDFYSALGMPEEGFVSYTDPARVIGRLKAIELWLVKKVQDGRGMVIANALRAYRLGCQSTPDLQPFVRIRTRSR